MGGILFSLLQVPDVCIELTWMGRNLEYLLGCLSSKDCLDNRQKQAYRVIHRVADVLEGAPDSKEINKPPVPDDKAKKSMNSSAEVRGEKDAAMWNVEALLHSARTVEDGIYDDRTFQQQTFVSFNGAERVCYFLERAEENEDPAKAVQMQVQEMLHLARGFLADAHVQARDHEKALLREALAEKNRNKPIQLPLELPEPEMSRPGDEILHEGYMAEGWRPSNFEEVGVSQFHLPRVPRLLRLGGAFLANSEVHRAYHLAALLRCLFAVLTVPGAERFRVDMRRWLAQSATQLRLIILVERCETYVTCHVAAKLLRLMSLVLRVDPDQTRLEDEHEHLVSLTIMAQFAKKVLVLLQPVLGQLGQSLVSEQQLTLCTEALRISPSSPALCPSVASLPTRSCSERRWSLSLASWCLCNA